MSAGGERVDIKFFFGYISIYLGIVSPRFKEASKSPFPLKKTTFINLLDFIYLEISLKLWTLSG